VGSFAKITQKNRSSVRAAVFFCFFANILQKYGSFSLEKGLL
jgi:hypothetical protein